MRAVHRPFAVLAVALLLAVPALTAVGSAAADSHADGAGGIRLRVWQGVGSAERLRVLAVSTRAAGGSWSHATALDMDGVSASGRYRYADMELDGAEARVWQAVDDARRVYLSARATGGSWREFGTVRLAMSGINHTGTHRYADVVVPASTPAPASGACAEGTLSFGFYAYFEPVSASAGAGPDDPAFATHTGYEADLLTALEAMDGAGLSFARAPIEHWEGIWLRSAGEYDVVGGGITILDSRRRDADGTELVAFTSGHVAFRQSLLVRADDADRLRAHADLTSADRVGALAGTTGEARLLRLAGLAEGANGALVAGARVVTPEGAFTADGSDRWFITAAASSPEFAGRTSIEPPSGDLPRVIYLGGEAGEAELLEALAAGDVEAVARGEIGNRDAARASNGAFAVTALDPAVEWGGFTVSAERPDLVACLDEHIDFLTNDRAIGYAEWSADPTVFLRRARLWNGERSGGGTVEPCAERTLRLGFYAHFPPVSASADPDPDAPGFHVQTGYEADLMTALEAMEGAGVAFERRGIPVWDGIWLRAAGAEYDVIGGGITILDSRRRDASGAEVVTFTRGHVAFPQSLLARAGDAARYADGYASAGGGDRIGAFAGATGETRMLPLVGLADADGVLVAGTRVVTPAGEFEADGSDRWFITAGGASPEFAGRTRLLPPADGLPRVVYVTDEAGTPEDRLVELLLAGDVELASMSEVSSLGYARDSGGALAVVAVEEERPLGGLALAVGDADLARCLSDRIDELTDGRRIGFARWADDPSVFMERARRWNAER